MTQQISRDSNIELLRLLCMFMIVVHHFIMQPAGGNTLLAQSVLGQIINSLCYISVNCFVLISGWFGIRVNWKGVWNLYFICAFYALSSYLFHICYDEAHIGKSLFLLTLFPFSHSQWWFINCYLILYLSAPLLNAAIEHISQKQYLTIIALYTMMNIYFGNILHTPFFNQDGYSAAQFIYIYLLAGYMHRYIPMDWINSHRWYMFGIYVLCSLTYVGCAHLSQLSIVNLGYNNIFNILAAVAFFLFATSFHFQNYKINSLAGSVLAVYLIQESRSFGHGFLYPLMIDLLSVHSVIGQLGMVFLISSGFFVICLLFDKLRRLLQDVLTKHLDSYIV